jgi:DNA polymerase (family X)
MQHFQSYRHIRRVEMAGVTRGTVVLHSGLQVDLRIVSQQSYGAALYYFTGSKAHNVAVRKLAVERGLRINKYGVFRVP